MAENCLKCKKSISKDSHIKCDYADCNRRYHRACVNINDALYEAMQKNPSITFCCDVCKANSQKQLLEKIHTLEDKLNKICISVNQIQSNMYQQYFPVGTMTATTNGTDGNNSKPSNLIVVGNNYSSDRLQVVCDYARWVQIGKFATHTTEEDIIEHLAEELKINKSLIKCTKLVKNNANLSQLSYCKFKISIPDYRFNELFNDAIWPSGVMILGKDLKPKYPSRKKTK